jgi:glycosyltransferase involved in cell wall biosynthesis
MKTTVVQVVPTLRDGGAEALIRNLVPLLAAEPDLAVHVVSVYDARLDDDERRLLSAPLHVIGRRGRADLSFAPRLVSTLRRLRPDVVHGHIHSGKFAGRMAALAAGVPNIVFTEHGDEARGIVHGSVNRALNLVTARFVVFTDAERLRYGREQGIALERIAVIGNGIPEPPASDVAATRAELGLGPNEVAVAIPARLEKQKNQQLALRALAALRATGRGDVRLFIIGAGSDADALAALRAELRLTSAVTFLGYRRDAQRITAACDLMALPSLWEKMPLVLGEAMLAGVPVVSAPWTGVDVFIEDGITGFLAADWSVDAFRAAMARPAGDAVARRAVASRAREAAALRFDLRRSVRLHADLYRELASHSRRRAAGRAAREPALRGPGA